MFSIPMTICCSRADVASRSDWSISGQVAREAPFEARLGGLIVRPLCCTTRSTIEIPLRDRSHERPPLKPVSVGLLCARFVVQPDRRSRFRTPFSLRVGERKVGKAVLSLLFGVFEGCWVVS